MRNLAATASQSDKRKAAAGHSGNDGEDSAGNAQSDKHKPLFRKSTRSEQPQQSSKAAKRQRKHE